ncbi:DnaJ domain-containing protein, putative [Eimeria maxima]|uniref:DnaJ domain-containing protein, putative n=1 Tax=Eimeria maxima TaxID=5804 RepID=U6M595_EIMMA|nr:DnaJ domain-containing protein, putative [Eimeria maxima]CDJ56850.1 DnaJ domain-containing protein, putative [Eimeria maxima]
MDASRGQLPAGLKGKCPYTVLGLCSEEGQPLSVQEAAADEASVAAREALTSKAIGTAYRRAALKAHPDKNKGRETEAAAAFLVVNLAFAFLSNAEQRSAYHKHLRTLLALRERRQEQQQRLTERDKEKQKYKAELDRREAEERHKTPKTDPAEAELQRIREQNAAFIKEQTELRQRRRHEIFREHSAQLLQQQQTQKAPYVDATHATDASSSAETETEETLEDILPRSVVLHWSGAATTQKTEAAAAAANGYKEEHQTCAEGASAEAEAAPTAAHTIGVAAAAAADGPTPASLCSQLWKHGAVDLCLFSRKKGIACISFSSRERAIEAALMLQRHRKNSNNNDKVSSVKLANKVKGFEQLLLRVRAAAAVSEQQQGEVDDDMKEAAELAAETEEAAGAFASAVASAAAAATSPHEPTAAPSPVEQQTVNGSSGSPSSSNSSYSSNSSSRMSLSVAEANSAAAAFGLGVAAASRQPISGAAACILEYVKSCSSRGLQEVQQQQAEAERDKGWEWVGGAKAAASMTMQELEDAAFGELQRKKQQLHQQ